MTGSLLRSSPFQKVFEKSLDLLCHLSKNGIILQINQAAFAILGYAPEELIARDIYEFVFEEDKAKTYAMAQKSINEELEVFNFTNRLVKRDGSLAFLEWTGTYDPAAGEGYCIGREITRRIHTEKKLGEQQEKLALAASLAELGYWEYDVINNTGYWSDTMYAIHGLCPSRNPDLTFEHYLTLVHPEDREKVARAMAQLHLYKKLESRFRIIQPNGSLVHLHNIYRITQNGEGVATMLSGVIRDVTKEVVLEERLQKQRELARRELVNAVISAQETERSKIGSELHDNVNQVLTTVKLYLEHCLSAPPNAVALQEKAIACLDGCINEIRAISKSLSSPTAGTITFEDSIADLVSSISVTNKLTVSAHLTGFTAPTAPIPTDLHLTVYRIVQEQLCNILKHSRAKHASVEILRNEKKLSLRILDDGIGFDAGKLRNGIGITNMIMRAKALGSDLIVKSSPGNGCTLSCSFNLS